MATYVVEIKLPYERASLLFGVLHSTTDTLFTPTFSESEELIAHMFAREYSGSNLLRDYTDAGQEKLVADLRAFLEAWFPAYREHMAPLPATWRAELPQEDSDEESFPFVADSSDLMQWYQDGDDRADVCQHAFHAWRKARL